MHRFVLLLLIVLVSGCASAGPAAQDAEQGRSWIAGDHHVHSRWSVGWNWNTNPPAPIKGGDAIYPIQMNAFMAQHYGLSWMVSTDHGGPNHSKIYREQAYPEFVQSREVVPGVIQFWGMEFDTPEADHSSLIIPHTHDEADVLEEIERRWNRRDAWPTDSTRNQLVRMIEALDHMKNLESPPVFIVNHAGRSANGPSEYTRVSPEEMRHWNNAAPDVAVGMAGAPGRQAAGINPDGSPRMRPRGNYAGWRTMGGFDPLTARLGGFWDSMLGEGRRWWITANSDSHSNWREGGVDFWPGEFSKTYVLAEKNHDDILEGIRSGRVFVTTGDLIEELWIEAKSSQGSAGIGEELRSRTNESIELTIRFLDPDGPNSHGDNPSVQRVDVITGQIHGIQDDLGLDMNPSTGIHERFAPGSWEKDGDYRVIRTTIENVDHDMYIRIRGTNTMDLEPPSDLNGEDPWADLWFYSNPIFVAVR